MLKEEKEYNLAPERKKEKFLLQSAKEIANIVIMVAILIVSQLALSFIQGVEVVTILLLCYCHVFGIKRGVMVATAFSLLRCFVWGFFPTVIILYLVYFNLFAIVFGLIGKLKREGNKKQRIIHLIIVTIVALLCTTSFTMLDNIITPLFYGYSKEAWKGYFYASFFSLVPQLICTLVTVLLLFEPISRVFEKVKNKQILN